MKLPIIIQYWFNSDIEFGVSNILERRYYVKCIIMYISLQQYIHVDEALQKDYKPVI